MPKYAFVTKVTFVALKYILYYKIFSIRHAFALLILVTFASKG